MKPNFLPGYRSGGLVLLASLILLAFGGAKVHGIAGLEGTFEFGLDAPWRMEPSKDVNGTIEYGAIPIQITIHGARHAGFDDILYAKGTSIRLSQFLVSLGNFRAVRVKELGPTETITEFPIEALHEIELMIGDWPWPHSPNAFPQYRICRVWKGQDPELFRAVYNTSEWHATLWYVPKNKEPGTSVALQIEVILERFSFPLVQTPSGEKVDVDVGQFITLRNYARVYLARDPLPRFDNRWLYGDFHYHSQGTDNEGEAGYNYRGVVRAMGAMGLDFLFATDHASSSEQIVDADLPPIGDIPGIAARNQLEGGEKMKEENVKSRGGVLRDMNAARFAFAHGLIYGAEGVNNETSLQASQVRKPQNFLGYGVVPQIFLGGEVDTIPEVKVSTAGVLPPGDLPDDWIPNLLPYGNGLTTNLRHLLAPGCCGTTYDLLEPANPDSYLVHDFQGMESLEYYGRAHLVYFPNSSILTVGNETSFVPSNTSKFGGATRRLDRPHRAPGGLVEQEALLPELERKGVAFVAHHLNTGNANVGPGGVPWTTDHMLLKAFRSSAVLGLEFWNEDTHFRTRVCSHDFCRNNADGNIYLGQEYGYERIERLDTDSWINAAVFLKKLLLDETGAEGPPKFLALPLEEVRHGFISGGANGSLFELYPFDVKNGLWQERTYETEHTLHHGAYDWDIMNLRGLDLENNTDLAWLPPGEPRKMFMGGGSDAHGDFNYRRAGYFLGTEDVNDTAIGKPRNLVFAGTPEGPVILHVDPPLFDPGVSPGLDSFSETADRKASLLAVKPLKVEGPPRNKPPVTDPGNKKPPVELPPPVLDPEPLPVERPGVTPPLTDPIVDPNPEPPVDPDPGIPPVTPPLTDPILDPNPEPPVNPDPGIPPVTPPLTDPILDPNPEPPVNPDPGIPPVTPPLTDPILDPNPEPPVDPDPGIPPVTPPLTDPILDPNPEPPVNPDPGIPPVTPPLTDPILDPNPEPNPNPPGDSHPPITDPLGDPVLEPVDPPSSPPIKPPHGGPVTGLGIDIRPHTQEQIIRALRSGRFCVTDGPATRIAIDRNGNNRIDDEDVQMGDTYRITKGPTVNPGQLGPQSVTLLTEVISTTEFGPINDIDIYVGVQPSPRPAGSTGTVEPRMYAPLLHGPAFHHDAKSSPQVSYFFGNRTYVRQEDNYWNGEFLGDALTWNQASADYSPRFNYTLVTTLQLDKYEVGQGIPADRFFVRAFVHTTGGTAHNGIDRYAYSNPIWMLRSELAVAQPDAGGDSRPVPEPPPSTSTDPTTPSLPPADPLPPSVVVTPFRTVDGRVVLTFDGTLQRTRTLSEPFRDVTGAANPYLIPMTDTSGFFRARK